MINEDIYSDDHPERAVSPVIGVILMVAITVILAAVIGTFVLGMADDVGESAPQASLSIGDHPDDYAGSGTNAFRIRHSGGADLPSDQLRIEVRDASSNALEAEWDDGWDVSFTNNFNGGTNINAVISNGDQLSIEDTGGVLTDDTQYMIRFIHKETGDTIAESTVTLR